MTSFLKFSKDRKKLQIMGRIDKILTKQLQDHTKKVLAHEQREKKRNGNPLHSKNSTFVNFRFFNHDDDVISRNVVSCCII